MVIQARTNSHPPFPYCGTCIIRLKPHHEKKRIKKRILHKTVGSRVGRLTRSYPSSSRTRCDRACCRSRRRTGAHRCRSGCRARSCGSVAPAPGPLADRTSPSGAGTATWRVLQRYISVNVYAMRPPHSTAALWSKSTDRWIYSAGEPRLDCCCSAWWLRIDLVWSEVGS